MYGFPASFLDGLSKSGSRGRKISRTVSILLVNTRRNMGVIQLVEVQNILSSSSVGTGRLSAQMLSSIRPLTNMIGCRTMRHHTLSWKNHSRRVLKTEVNNRESHAVCMPSPVFSRASVCVRRDE